MSTDADTTTSASALASPAVDVYADKSRVYTKTGDRGHTSLFNQERRSKSDDYFAALGDTDELNANIGVVRAHCTGAIESGGASDECAHSYAQLNEQLSEIQSRLFDLGAHLATPRNSSNAAQIHRTNFADEHVDQLESWIDDMESSLDPLRNFILPGGGLVATHLHVCRAVCRRAERATVPLVARADSEPIAQQYLNRLSDYMFVAARFASLHSGAKEAIWKKPREPRGAGKKANDATKEPAKTTEQ